MVCHCEACEHYELKLESIIDTAGPHGNNRFVPGLQMALATFRQHRALLPTFQIVYDLQPRAATPSLVKPAMLEALV